MIRFTMLHFYIMIEIYFEQNWMMIKSEDLYDFFPKYSSYLKLEGYLSTASHRNKDEFEKCYKIQGLEKSDYMNILMEMRDLSFSVST